MNDPLAEQQLKQVFHALNARTGLNLTIASLGMSSASVAPLLSRLRSMGVGQLVSEIESESSLFDKLVDELTIRETYFFREPLQFDFIRDRILPEVTERLGEAHTVRCWSAACASGEEAYSIAIVLREAGLENRSYVLASDISLEALSNARRGKYRAWSLRSASASPAKPYLTPDGELNLIHESLRRRVDFVRLNLTQPNYGSNTDIREMDLILCRNVLLYFDDSTIGAVTRRLFNSLAEGGWLLTAATDPPLANHASFEVVVSEAGIAYRRPPCRPSAVALANGETISRVIEGRFSAVTACVEDNPEPAPLAPSFALGTDNGLTAVAPRRRLSTKPTDWALRLRTLANQGNPAAIEFAEKAIELKPLSVEPYYLLANLRTIENNYPQAVALLRKAIYLAPAMAILHFTLGSLLQRLGELSAARRCLRRAAELAQSRPAQEIVPLSDGEPAAVLAAAAFDLLRTLDALENK
jgi:chemotaxis protein methyltransferase CheR